MADLMERLAFSSEQTGRPRISGHEFGFVLMLYATGTVDRAYVATYFDLIGDELSQATVIADELDTRTGDAKLVFALRVDKIATGVNTGSPRYVTGTTVNSALIIADLGI